MKPATRLSQIQPSATLEITARAKAMKAAGADVISLGAGEPDFDTPSFIVDACVTALKEGFTRYTPVGGISTLIEAIREKFQRDNTLAYEPEEILVSCGAKHSLYNAFMAVLDPGDEVLIPTPAWVSYQEMIRLAGGKPVFVPTIEENGFQVSPETLSEHLSSRTKALILNSPSNPTGGAYGPDALAALGEFALRNNLLIVSDEIYEKLVYGSFRQASIASLSPELKKATLVINGLSKSYAMTGWRLGYAAGSRDLIKAMKTIQSHSTSNPTSFAQRGGVAALNAPTEVIDRMVSEFGKRRDYFISRLKNIPGITCFEPKGAFYTFPKFSGYYGTRWVGGEINSSVDMSAYLLETARVAVVPGSAFHADEYQRLSFASSLEELLEAAARIEEALRLLGVGS